MEYEEALNASLRAKVARLEYELYEVEIRGEKALKEKKEVLQKHLSKVERQNKLQIWAEEVRVHNLELKNKSLRREVAKGKAEEAKLEREVLISEICLKTTKASVSPLKRKVEKARRRERESRNEATRSERRDFELAEELHHLRQKQKAASEELETRTSDVSRAAYDATVKFVDLLEEKNKKLSESIVILKTKYENLSNDEKAIKITQNELVQSMIEDQRAVNAELRSYMDKILQTVVDRCPQILEVRPPSSP